MKESRASNSEGLWARVKEESELIAIFFLFLMVLIAHESLLEISKQAGVAHIFRVWVILLCAAVGFFVFVFRSALRQTQRMVVELINDKIGPLSQQLSFAVQEIGDKSMLDEMKRGESVLPEMKVMDLEKTVTKAVWVVSPDFRYELAEDENESYVHVIADNLIRGVKYYYFVPADGVTGTLVRRFEAALRAYCEERLVTGQALAEVLSRITVVSLTVKSYPATAIFGCALYEINEMHSAFVEYFPKGSAAWNLVVRNGASAGAAKGAASLNSGATEIRGTILLRGRFEQMLADAEKAQRNTGYGVKYYESA